jgi:serine/threonine protein kinase
MSSSAVPKEIGPYRIESELGRGMMGVVYKAQDTRNRQRVALKIIRMAFAVTDEQKVGFERRFLEEAHIVARLDHPGIVGVHEVGRDVVEDAPYIAFEYLEGQTLAEMIKDGPLPWRTVLPIVARVAEALEHAHRQGIIHRDIKPANVMVVKSGDPKIMDFGLAKRDAGLELTSTGQFLGTPLYMSPEQALGKSVDARTDIFSLGSVAYTLLTGKRAFEGDSIPQVMNKVTYQTPPPPTLVKRDLPPDVDYLVGRAMAKDPDDRYARAFTFAEDINDVWHGRPPRHRASWRAPATGEGTVVSTKGRPTAARARSSKKKSRGATVAPIEELPLLDLPLDPVARTAVVPKRRGRKRASSAWYVVLALILLGAGFYWRATLLRSANPPSVDSHPARQGAVRSRPPLSPTPASAATSTDAATPEPTATTEPTPTDEPTEAPTATAVPTKKQTTKKTPAPKVAPAAASSKLAFVLEHHSKSGSVHVWIDGESVLDEKLSSHITQDLKVVKLRTGKLQRSIPVPPGTHRVRVEVRTGDDIRVKESTATFKAGGVRRLEANTNRVTGGLSLDWE